MWRYLYFCMCNSSSKLSMNTYKSLMGVCVPGIYYVFELHIEGFLLQDDSFYYPTLASKYLHVTKEDLWADWLFKLKFWDSAFEGHVIKLL